MIDQTLTTLTNAGFEVLISGTMIIVSLNRSISIMEVQVVLEAAGISAQYGRIGGNVVVML